MAISTEILSSYKSMNIQNNALPRQENLWSQELLPLINPMSSKTENMFVNTRTRNPVISDSLNQVLWDKSDLPPKRTDYSLDTGNFYSLKQAGLTATRSAWDADFVVRPVSRENSHLNGTNLSKLEAERQKTLQFFDVESLTNKELHREILPKLFESANERNNLREKTYVKLASAYRIEGDLPEIKEKFTGFATVADKTIDLLIENMPPYVQYLEEHSQIRKINDPLDLALITFDKRFTSLERFQAKRKLTLMALAASIERREKEVQSTETHRKLNEFLDNFVLDAKDNDTSLRYILSTHDTNTFETMNVQVLTEDEKKHVENNLPNGQILTEAEHRTFSIDGQSIGLALMKTREKSTAKQVLKLLRKGHENPALAVDDQVGFMAAFNSEADLKLFLKCITKGGMKANILIDNQEIENTLNDGEHKAASKGSSSELQWYKSMMQIGPIRPEFIGHVLDKEKKIYSYTDYYYKKGLAHGEYSVTRLFDCGVVEMLLPSRLLHYDPDYVKAYAYKKVRNNIENSKAA